MEEKIPLIEYIYELSNCGLRTSDSKRRRSNDDYIKNLIGKIEIRVKNHPEEINKQNSDKGYTAVIFLFFKDEWISFDGFLDEFTWIRYEILKLFVENGLNVNLKTTSGETIFMRLIEKVDLDDFRLLMKCNPNLEELDNNGRNCYFYLNYYCDESVKKFEKYMKAVIIENYVMWRRIEGFVMEEARKLREEINILAYRPGNIGYLDAKNHFEDLVQLEKDEKN